MAIIFHWELIHPTFSGPKPGLWAALKEGTVGRTAQFLRQDVLRGLEEVALGLVGGSQPGPATSVERGGRNP